MNGRAWDILDLLVAHRANELGPADPEFVECVCCVFEVREEEHELMDRADFEREAPQPTRMGQTI